MSNILNHNRLPFKCRLTGKDYWDFHLHLGREYGVVSPGLQEECLAAFIDTTIPECIKKGNLSSVREWDGAVNKGLILENYGLTSVDNGGTVFNPYYITDEEFEQLFYHTELRREKAYKQLILSPVHANLQRHDYGFDVMFDDCGRFVKLYGGFYQGFFRTGDGCQYSVLPSDIGNGVSLEFELYRKDFDDYDVSRTLNAQYPENKGIFFYWGTRAENKWVRYYGDLCDEEKEPDKTTGETSDGSPLSQPTSNPVISDNKFLIYTRTCGGHTVLDDKEGETPTVEINVENTVLPDNPFLIYSRACDGTTVLNDDEYFREHAERYNLYSDLWDNALAFQITDDGRVGYKYLVKDCDAEDPSCSYKILSEFSNPENVPYCEWVKIHVRVMPVGSDKMRLMFYVNGRLVLYSKEMPRLNLRELADSSDKQAAVPFNISLGGGTQGLSDVVYEDWRKYDEYPVYPLEKEFGGSFIGYFKSFKFYSCQLNYQQINENAKVNMPTCKDAKIYCGAIKFNTKPSKTPITEQGQYIQMLNEYRHGTKEITVRLMPDSSKKHFRLVLAIPESFRAIPESIVDMMNGVDNEEFQRFSILERTATVHMQLGDEWYSVWYYTYAAPPQYDNRIEIKLT